MLPPAKGGLGELCEGLEGKGRGGGVRLGGGGGGGAGGGAGGAVSGPPPPFAYLRLRAFARSRKISRYSQISVTIRPKAPYHSMYFGAPPFTPVSMKSKSRIKRSEERRVGKECRCRGSQNQ